MSDNALDVKTSMIFKLVFTILSCFFLLFFIISLNFLIPTVIVQIFNPIVEFLIPIEHQVKKQKQILKNIK